MQRFTHFVGVDWSGAKGRHHKGLMIAVCENGGGAPRLVSPSSGETTWSRIECGKWIEDGCGLSQDARILIGIDAAFGMPFIDQGAYFPDTEIATSAPELWTEIATHCKDAEDYFAGPFIERMRDHFHQHGGRRGKFFSRRMRVAEDHCRDAGFGPCESVFNLVGASQVGKSALSTMNMLHALATFDHVSIWPFDECATNVNLVEIYAAAFAKMGRNRGKMNSLEALNAALIHLGSSPFVDALPRKADDAADAIITSAGLRAISADRKYWYPPKLSTMVRRTEGWIFGVV